MATHNLYFDTKWNDKELVLLSCKYYPLWFKSREYRPLTKGCRSTSLSNFSFSKYSPFTDIESLMHYTLFEIGIGLRD